MSDDSKSELLQSLQTENDHLRSENQRLRDLVVSLSATLLRNVVLEHGYVDRKPSDAEHLVYEAEQCFRCARLPGLKEAIAAGLEAAGHEFMARAVDIETSLQREKWKK